MPDISGISNLTNALGTDATRFLQEAMQANRAADGTAPAEGVAFSDMLDNLLSHVDQAQKQADESIQRLAAGDSVSLQDVVLRLEEADLTFRLMKEIRDKLISAYKEVMSMQG
jgi:flagellar hook-basal body complex protein FliE